MSSWWRKLQRSCSHLKKFGNSSNKKSLSCLLTTELKIVLLIYKQDIPGYNAIITPYSHYTYQNLAHGRHQLHQTRHPIKKLKIENTIEISDSSIFRQ